MQQRLLIVEDEPAIVFALKLFFDRKGYAVDTAQTREEAEALLGPERYAVVIADLRLGESSSTEGLEIISDVHRVAPETKVVLLTAYGSPDVEMEARQRGAHVLLHKPQPLPAIADVVASLLRSA